MPERLYSPYQVANLLGVTEGEVLAWIQKGLLAVHRFPDESVRVRQRGLVDFLRRQGINLKAVLSDAPGNGANGDGEQNSVHIDNVRSNQAPASDQAAEEMTAEIAEEDDQADAPEPAPTEIVSSAGPAAEATVSPDVPAGPKANSAEQIVSAVLQEAIDRKAEAVLLESRAGELSLAMKVGGVLYDKPNFRTLLPTGLAPRIVQHVRAIAGLAGLTAVCGGKDFSFSLDGGARQALFRLECCPTVAGERLAIIPVENARPMGLSELGLASRDQERLRGLLSRRGGLIILAGPARSGRTTLLRAIAAALPQGMDAASVERKSLAADADFTRTRPAGDGAPAFDDLLEALLRQGSDAVLVDDVRHARTIRRSAEAAMNGRLVVATMRAGGCSDVLHLLAQALGDDEDARWDLAGALAGVVTCRLAGRLCEHCRREVQPAAELLTELGLKEFRPGSSAFEADGCSRCWRTGRNGQVGIYSLATVGSPVADAIRAGRDASIVAEAMSVESGSILQAGLEKVTSGQISLPELARQMRA